MRAALGAVAALAILAAPYAAQAQAWKDYSYPEDGFAVQFPAPPAMSTTSYKTQTGLTLPAVIYSVQQDGVIYSVTVADFSTVAHGDQVAMEDATTAVHQQGEVKVETTERIDRYYGRDITLAGKDGSHSAIAIFFANDQLYELVGKALPPDAEAGSGKTARFQQTLVFIDRTGRQPRRPDDGLGGGGPPGLQVRAPAAGAGHRRPRPSPTAEARLWAILCSIRRPRAWSPQNVSRRPTALPPGPDAPRF